MEVYGHQFPINYFEPHVTQLAMQRRRSQKDLLLIKLRIRDGFETLNSQMGPGAKETLGFLWDDLVSVKRLMDKVTDYFQAKNEILDSSINEEARTNLKPLFPNLNEPTAEEVGYLIDFQCGHT